MKVKMLEVGDDDPVSCPVCGGVVMSGDGVICACEHLMAVADSVIGELLFVLDHVRPLIEAKEGEGIGLLQAIRDLYEDDPGVIVLQREFEYLGGCIDPAEVYVFKGGT